MRSQLETFLEQWRSPSPTLTVHTSGSTGTPKALEVEKERMRASARMTCDFLGLKPTDTALLCMPLQFIAGMMMVVRAEERGLQLISVEPSNRPLQPFCSQSPLPIGGGREGAFTLAAMVPSQVYETLQHPAEHALFCRIRHVIIGGGALPPALEAELRTLPNHIWHSYGMTETLSHIALRPIAPSISLSSPSGESHDAWDSWFEPLPGITLSQTPEGCLVIDAPALNPERLVTHDIVEFREEQSATKLSSPLGEAGRGQSFRILGRSDNTVCSGGIKIQIEEVERHLSPTLADTVQFTSRPDPKFGEVLVCLTTQALTIDQLRTLLPNPYWVPKHIIRVAQLPRTATDKPDRAEAKRIAQIMNYEL